MLFAVAVYLLIQLPLVGRAEIGGSSEAREAHVVSEIVKYNEWVLPRRNGIIPSKPPLFHWIGAAISTAFDGVSEFTVRIPSVVAGLFTVLCAGLCAFRLASLCDSPARAIKPAHTLLLSSAVLSLSYGFYQMSCQAMVDMVFCACVWGALTSLLLSDPQRWISEKRPTAPAVVGFWFFCGLSILARGPLGAVLCLALAGSGAWIAFGLKRTLREVVRPSLGWLFLLLPLAWYWLAYQAGGDAFVERQLLFENVKRLTGGQHINEDSWWFYGPSLLRTTFPWGLIAIVVGGLELRRKAGVSRHPRERLVIVLPLLVLLAGIAILSCASGKRHSYLLPLMPCVAIEVALLLTVRMDRCVTVWRGRILAACHRARSAIGVMAVLVVVGGILILSDFWPGEVDDATTIVKEALSRVLLPAGVVLLVGLLGARLVPAQGGVHLVFTLWAGLFSLMAVIVSWGSTIKAHLKDFPEMARQVTALRSGAAQLVVIKDRFDEYFDPILFYIGAPVVVHPAEFEEFRCNPGAVYFTHTAWLTELISQRGGSDIVLLGVVREALKDAAPGRKRREVSIFRCSLGLLDKPVPSNLQSAQVHGATSLPCSTSSL